FPLIWASSLIAYLYFLRRLSGVWRILPLAAGCLALWLIRLFIESRYLYRWSLDQVFSVAGVAGFTAVEQVWLYDWKYLVIAALLLFVCGVLFLERLDLGEDMLTDPPVQIWILHLVAFAVLPSAIQFPQYQHSFAFIPERISLLCALMF